MGNRRTANLVVALALGGLAAAGVWTYLRGVDRRAFQGARLVPVLVVDKDIKRQMPGDQVLAEGRIRPDRVPVKFRPRGALTDLSAVRGKVAATDLLAGQMLSLGQFVESTASASTFAQRIPEGQVAISIQVDEVRGVAELIQPGDRVNILVLTPDGVRLLYQSVDVIAVGTGAAQHPTSSAQGPPAASQGLVTFAVPLLAAEKIALAASTAGPNGIYLTLVPPQNTTASVPPVSASGLFQGPLSPYA